MIENTIEWMLYEIRSMNEMISSCKCKHSECYYCVLRKNTIVDLKDVINSRNEECSGGYGEGEL